jgi:hypothetical protein
MPRMTALPRSAIRYSQMTKDWREVLVVGHKLTHYPISPMRAGKKKPRR